MSMEGWGVDFMAIYDKLLTENSNNYCTSGSSISSITCTCSTSPKDADFLPHESFCISISACNDVAVYLDQLYPSITVTKLCAHS